MAAYQELCELYARARARANQRRQRCAVILEQVGERIVGRLGVPEGAHGWRPVESEPEEGKSSCALAEAMSADDEGVWHAGLQILLRDGEDELPIFFDLCAQEEGDHFLVSIAGEEPTHRIHPGEEAALEGVAADVERRLRKWLAENLDRVLGAAGRGEQFGLYL